MMSARRDAALAADHARRFIEAQNAVEAAAVDQIAARIETGVAVTAAEAIREQRTRRSSFEKVRNLIIPCRLVHSMVRDLRITAPRENSRDRLGYSGLPPWCCAA